MSDFYIPFKEWFVKTYQTDFLDEPFFIKCCHSAYLELEKSTINGISYLDYYKDNLNEKILEKTLRLARMLIKQIPSPDSPLNLTVVGIHLNQYDRQKNALQIELNQLIDQYSLLG